jgi:hypothetical protein
MTLKNAFRSVPLISVLLFPMTSALVAHADDPSRIPPTVNFSPGPEYADDVRMFQGIPSLERSPQGRLWAAWYGGGVTEDCHNYILVATSDDDGVSFSPVKFVIDPDREGPVRAFDPCPWVDPTGRLWIFWAQRSEGGGDPVTMAITTGNPDVEEPTWSPARMIHDGIMMCKPSITREGVWLLPTAIWKRDASCRIVASSDQGETWTLRGTASVPDPKDRNCDEPMLIQRNDGSLWLLVRTNYGIGESVSQDGGRTFTPVAPSNIPHPAARFFIRRLDSGSLLLVKHGPLDERTGRSLLTAFVSDDDGATWQGGLMLDERNGVSYPDGTQGDDGRIYIIYDWNRVSEKHILMATFTEEDVRAGEPVSDACHLRQLVNDADGVVPPRQPRERPSLDEVEFDGNEDGETLGSGPAAELQSPNATEATLVTGRTIFTDRTYTFRDIPEALKDKCFLKGSIDGVSFKCERTGVVFVMTPSEGRNPDSQAVRLVEQGWTKTKFLMPTPPLMFVRPLLAAQP